MSVLLSFYEAKHALSNELNMPQSSCLKWTYWRSGVDYRVSSLFTMYLTAKGITPESLSSIGQF